MNKMKSKRTRVVQYNNNSYYYSSERERERENRENFIDSGISKWIDIVRNIQTKCFMNRFSGTQTK